MKIRISHLNGRYDAQRGTDLCELFCIPDDETNYYLFENGWLPLLNNEWYQSRSSRIKISSLSSRRRYQLKKMKVTTDGDYKKIFENSKLFYNENAELFLDTVLSFKHEIYYFNDSIFAVLNWFDDIPYFSFVASGSNKKEGIIPMTCYHFLNILKGHTYPYLYIGEWYEQFHYKSSYPNFEWWDGEKWLDTIV